MPFITFIYKVGKINKTYYGKYCFDYISDDHEGLDNIVKNVFIDIGCHIKNVLLLLYPFNVLAHSV